MWIVFLNAECLYFGETPMPPITGRIPGGPSRRAREGARDPAPLDAEILGA